MNPPEHDPFGLSAHAPGAKLDASKPKVATFVLRYFPRALLAVARISEGGARKYTRGGWKHVPNGVERYGDAEVRHILDEAIHGEIDPDFGEYHKAHKAWDALAELELFLIEKELQCASKPTGTPTSPAASKPQAPSEPGWTIHPDDLHTDASLWQWRTL